MHTQLYLHEQYTRVLHLHEWCLRMHITRANAAAHVHAAAHTPPTPAGPQSWKGLIDKLRKPSNVLISFYLSDFHL